MNIINRQEGGSGGTNSMAHLSNDDRQILTLPLSSPPSSTSRGSHHMIHIPSPLGRRHRPEDGLPEYINRAYRASLPPAAFMYSPPSMCGPKCQLCGRVFCSFIIGVLFVLPFLIFLDYFLIYPDDQLKFEIRSFAMTNFTTNSTGAVLAAKWELKMWVKNPNTKLKAEFQYLDIVLKYDDKTELDAYRCKDVVMLPASEILMNVSLSVPSSSWSHRSLYRPENWMVRAGKDDLPFDLEMRFFFRFKIWNVLVETFDNVEAECHALPVTFATLSVGRNWTGRHPCEVKDYNPYKGIFSDSEWDQ